MADPVQVVAHGGGGEQGDAAGQLVVMPSKFRTSVVNRTGHARFRRGPVVVQETAACPEEARAAARDPIARCDGVSASASSSFPSSVTGVTGEGSVSNARAMLPAAGGRSAGDSKRPRPPPMQFASDHSSALRHNNDVDDGKPCHCSKQRKKSSWRARRRIRVPAISSRNADIPADDYSWRNGYYKCSTVRGCPARKHVERDPAEPAMLIVTYDGDHRHGDPADAPPPCQAEHRTYDRSIDSKL
ncbi:hypothetical protein E2562_022540 [Oryza meyeriana var. granulata]|uniref:WRKY domain-containing protein n=1 Tax=Oryza meyeriana var. granulata TaxID=110450 RepID=A0A6G1FAP1_9ORYZ|nr:hypothetical protein E2562_022540 [Oryza meyeriana var. granulata]